MKLYLSSYLWGDEFQELLKLLDGFPKKVAIITNSADQFPEEGILKRLEDDIKLLSQFGLVAQRFDLRKYFEDENTDRIEKDLKTYGLVWVRGANVFVLRRAMKQSGLDRVLPALIKNNTFVYGGYSAGGCILSPSLRGVELIDDASIIPEGYIDQETIWEGLGVLDFAFVPHYKSNHPESADVDNYVSYLKVHHMPYKTLHDGEVIIIDN